MKKTSVEQSHRLAALGLDPNTATESWYEVVTPENETYYCSGYSAPRGVLSRYEVGYLFDGMNPPEGCYDNLDPMTSAYELCVWCLESGYVKRKGMLYES